MPTDDTSTPAALTMAGLAARLREQRDRIRTEMGGRERIQRLHGKGRPTIRERIDALVDPGSFMEIGTFAHSERHEVRDITPGDGKIGGIATVDGRTVVVLGDDMTVMHGSSSNIGGKKKTRIEHYALKNGYPFVFFGETGGGRLPDMLGAEGFTGQPGDRNEYARHRRIPQITAIVGESFGGSSFVAAQSDIVIQRQGAAMAVTGPRVIEIATKETVGMEELGGADVHAEKTGMIDLVAADDEELYRQIRTLLSFLPSNTWQAPPRHAWDGNLDRDEGMYDVVPLRRQRAYDVRRVIRRLTDDGGFFELKPRFGSSLVTGFGRIAGRSVGFVASQPSAVGGVLTPETSDKGTAFLCLCEANNIPLVILQDQPGFMVGKRVEHDRLLSKAIMFLHALGLLTVPRYVIVLRKAFGLGYFSLGGRTEGSERVLAWPSAELSFMDPEVGVNVVYAEKLKDDPAEKQRIIDEWSKMVGPEGAAGIMGIDEIIDPADTRRWLRYEIDRVHIPIPPHGHFRPLSYWPTCY